MLAIRTGLQWAVILAVAWAAMGLFLPGGFLIGAAQWLVFTRRLRGSAWWIPAYGAAWVAALWLSMRGTMQIMPDFLTFGLVGGGAAGFMQWRTLRTHAKKAWRWIPVSVVAACAGCWAGEFAGFSLVVDYSVDDRWAWAGGGAVGGIIFGFISGAVFAKLVRPATT